MELYTDKLLVGKIGKIVRDENHSKRIIPTNEYIIFEKNFDMAIDVLNNNRFILKNNVFKCVDNDNICIVDSKFINLFLPDKTLKVVNDYDILELFDRVNNSDIYDNIEQEDFSKILIFRNATVGRNNNIILF